MGIEPTYKGFADPCLTTWLPGHTFFSKFLFVVLFYRTTPLSLILIAMDTLYILAVARDNILS